MTRIILVEQILSLLGGGRNTRAARWRQQEIALSVNEVRNTAARDFFYLGLKTGDSYIDPAWLSSYENIQLQLDTNRSLWYCTLPALPIAIPEGKGISTVSLMQDQYSLFIPLKNNSMWLYNESGQMDLQGNTGYFQEGLKLFFPNYQPNGIDTVLIKEVANSQDITDDEFFPCPPDIYEQIVKTVMSMYLPMEQKPVDMSNDNVPK
jgi:hypothetical protein